MPRDREKMREAAAVPLVLFGEHGRTVEGYRPADEDLAGAGAGGYVSRRGYQPVRGPYLRWAHGVHRRSKTGVVGISVSLERSTGRHFVRVRLGATCRRFCVETLGRTEAFRRALELRREHLKKIVEANAVILAARERHPASLSSR